MLFLVDNQDILLYTVSIVNKKEGKKMTHPKDTMMDLFGYSILFIFAMGWIDVLWMFGVENSKQYTWWYLINVLGQ